MQAYDIKKRNEEKLAELDRLRKEFNVELNIINQGVIKIKKRVN